MVGPQCGGQGDNAYGGPNGGLFGGLPAETTVHWMPEQAAGRGKPQFLRCQEPGEDLQGQRDVGEATGARPSRQGDFQSKPTSSSSSSCRFLLLFLFGGASSSSSFPFKDRVARKGKRTPAVVHLSCREVLGSLPNFSLPHFDILHSWRPRVNLHLTWSLVSGMCAGGKWWKVF